MLAVLIVYFSVPRASDDELSEDQLFTIARQLPASMKKDDWSGMSGAPLEQFPPYTNFRNTPAYWQYVSVPDTSMRAVAYFYPAAGRRFVPYLVYVMRTNQPFSLNAKFPPPQPYPFTPGMSMGMWQSGGYIYVLAVPGDQKNYKAILPSSNNFANPSRARPNRLTDKV